MVTGVIISDEAVEALANVLAQEALVEADMAGAGWDALVPCFRCSVWA